MVLLVIGLTVLSIGAACSARDPREGLNDTQRRNRSLAIAWSWDIRLTRQLWRLARESAGQPSTDASAEAEALVRRDVLRAAVAKRPPEPFADQARELRMSAWGTAAVALLGEASWRLQDAQRDGDPEQQARGLELLPQADASMERYLAAARTVLAGYGADLDGGIVL